MATYYVVSSIATYSVVCRAYYGNLLSVMATCSVLHILESQLATQIYQTTEDLTFGKKISRPGPIGVVTTPMRPALCHGVFFLCVWNYRVA